MAELIPNAGQRPATPPAYAAPAAQAVPATTPATTAPAPTSEKEAEIILIGHSQLLYWWPVWLVGFVMAGLTSLDGQMVQIGDSLVRFHPNHNLGVFFFLTLFLVIVVSNVSFRGLVSVAVILTAMLITVVLIYFDWWGIILGWFGDLKIYLNQGAYFWFSTLLFLVWAFTVFAFDRFSYWRVRAGQVTNEYVLGTGSRSFGSGKLTLEKRRSDVFRHWLFGLGSGDLTIHMSGATREDAYIPNVLFIHSKMRVIERMIRELPTEPGPA